MIYKKDLTRWIKKNKNIVIGVGAAITLIIITILFSNPSIGEAISETISGFFGLLGLLLICSFCCLPFWLMGGGWHRAKGSQQVVINNTEPKRVCKKCGCQNAINTKFCTDCGQKIL